jgi:hypothetical protein
LEIPSEEEGGRRSAQLMLKMEQQRNTIKPYILLPENTQLTWQKLTRLTRMHFDLGIGDRSKIT